jgi:tRNA(Ile)-lysidine synthase
MKKAVTAVQHLSSLAAEVQRGLGSIRGKKKLLVAVSGGADSVALLHLLMEAGYRNLVVAHFNHCLRGVASNADARFVERIAVKLSLPFALGSAPVRELAKTQKLSLETAARQARYAFLATAAKKHRCRSLLLAHHADDQVETCLFQFLRGSGAAGLAGMKASSSRKIEGITLTLHRPLLGLTKQQLLDYLSERKLRYREDASNSIAEASSPSRNKLRLRILPLIEELLGPAFRGAITRSASIFADEEDLLASLCTPMALQSELSIKLLKELHPALRRRVIHAWLKNQGIDEPGFAEVERTASLLDFDHEGIGTAKINLPGNRHARRKAGVLFISSSELKNR